MVDEPERQDDNRRYEIDHDELRQGNANSQIQTSKQEPNVKLHGFKSGSDGSVRDCSS